MKIAVIDIGGTAIKSALYENDKLHDRRETPSDGLKGGSHIMELAKSIVADYQNFDAIGISTAGQVDSRTGVIIFAGETIPNYTGFDVRWIFNEKFNVPVYVENDVNAMAIGEAAFGAGKNHNDFLCLTYGTGIGGAIIRDGKIYTGSSYSAGEFGIIITHAERPLGEGIYEKFASATALIKNVNAEFAEITNGRQVFMNIGDQKVKHIVDNWIHEILCGLTNLVHIFNPSLIIMGGGIMEAEYIVPEVRKRLSNYVVPSMMNVEVQPAKLGNDAGLWGIVHRTTQELCPH